MVWTISLVLAWTVIFHSALKFSMCSAEHSREASGRAAGFPQVEAFDVGSGFDRLRGKRNCWRGRFLTLFSAARHVACLKEGGTSCAALTGTTCSLRLYSSLCFSPLQRGGGLEKQAGPRWCGEVGTFQNIVACHRKDDWWHQLDYDQTGQWPVCLTCVSTRRRR